MVCFTSPYLEAFVFSVPIKTNTIVSMLIQTFEIGICLALACCVSPSVLLACNENAVVLWTRKCEISSIVTKLRENINLLQKFTKNYTQFLRATIIFAIIAQPFPFHNFLAQSALHSKAL
jgi:hypothetical protein